MILAASQRMHRPAMLGLQIYIEAGRGGHCRQPLVSPSIKAGSQQGKRTSGPLSRGPTLFKAHNCALLSLPAAFCSPLRLRRRDSASIGFSVLRSRAVLAHSHSLRLLASFAAYPTRAPSPPLPPPASAAAGDGGLLQVRALQDRRQGGLPCHAPLLRHGQPPPPPPGYYSLPSFHFAFADALLACCTRRHSAISIIFGLWLL